jgi:putative transposase
MDAALTLTPMIGATNACALTRVKRPTLYRFGRHRYGPRPKPPPHPRALHDDERQQVLDVCHSSRFVDRSPAEIVHTLLDEGSYLASERTFYRILAASNEVRERRNQRVHPPYAKPELLAHAPNELWSWDITDLRGPQKWTRFKLYKILDVYSRYVVGWMVAHRESAHLAERLIAETLAKQNIKRKSADDSCGSWFRDDFKPGCILAC